MHRLDDCRIVSTQQQRHYYLKYDYAPERSVTGVRPVKPIGDTILHRLWRKSFFFCFGGKKRIFGLIAFCALLSLTFQLSGPATHFEKCLMEQNDRPPTIAHLRVVRAIYKRFPSAMNMADGDFGMRYYIGIADGCYLADLTAQVK